MQAKNYDIIYIYIYILYITINSRLYKVEDLSILTHATARIPFSLRPVYRRSCTKQKLL